MKQIFSKHFLNSQSGELVRRPTVNLNEQKAGALLQPHCYEINKIADALCVSIKDGLSSIEATERSKSGSSNTLPQTAKTSWLRLLLNQFSSIIIWLLAVAAIVALFTENELEAIAIFVVLLLNALIGFSIEWQAGRALDALRKQQKRRRGLNEMVLNKLLIQRIW